MYDRPRQGNEQKETGSNGFQSRAPAISVPKGGGAIRGIGEKFAANPVTGTGSMTVPIATSPGRSGFGPQLSLSYDSGAGNGPFGFGWNLSSPSITRKTDKGLPKYQDADESDVFILSGAEDLVPVLPNDCDGWKRDESIRTVDGNRYCIKRYRPRIEGLFARIERWTNEEDPSDIFWRSISKDNITTWYGRTAESRIANPSDPTHVFSWLICESHDDKGNVIVYQYKEENSDTIDRCLAHERNRTEETRSVNRYLKYIKYGNRTPYYPSLKENQPRTPLPCEWLFEVVFDYGEHDPDSPTPTDPGLWPCRNDPFSVYRSGFEVRTYRLCQRVLMFHHFADEPGVGANCLVRSTDFTYSFEEDPTNARNPIFSFLLSVTQSGYRRRDNGSFLKKSLPPLEYEYTQPVVHEAIQEVDPESLENLPYGLDGARYQWLDLDGEGLSGILTEQDESWFYKRNLSPLNVRDEKGREMVTARFGPVDLVAKKPSLAAISSRRQQFLDLAGDGRLDLVALEAPTPGFYERTHDESWETFVPFESLPVLDWDNPNLKFIDLTGDGHADVLITEDEAFCWHASLAEVGFGPAQRVHQVLDEEKGPRLVLADAIQSIYLADLSGDGLTDLVRIRSGEVCYWPNVGYGRFGTKVTMDNAPWFDNPDLFDQRRIRLADIDGSGVTDIIYLGRDGVRLYFNQSGNSWSKARELVVFPSVDNLSSVQVTDLLGNGTACLVWSSPLLGETLRPMRYVDLMGGQKPHLLVKTANNLGAETHVRYAPSTKFYLMDKVAGKPWITKIPFPVHVVERIETYDRISRNRFVTRYAYHHGYFDGVEREFRGFGMVEQFDTEQFAALAGGNVPADNIAPESHVPPVYTKTWFHTGVYLGRDHVSDYFAGLLNAADKGEYFREPGLTNVEARASLLPDTMLPSRLTIEEEREACRALKGSMLRQEVYADDAGKGATPKQVQRARTPYAVTEQNFTIRTVQPRGGNRYAVFFTHAREAISYHYERNPADPRIQHALTLEVDDFGNVLKQVAVGYGRRVSPLAEPWDRDRQTTALLTYTENRVTNAIASPDTHRTPLPCEAITFELTGYAATGAASRYQASDFVEPDPAAPGRLRHKFTAPEVAYEATANGSQRRRPIEWLRTLYRRDDLNRLLPLGALQPLALPGESYKLAFTPGLLTQVFQRPRQGQPGEPLLPDPKSMLGGQAGDRGGYVQSQILKADGRFPVSDADDLWWIPSGHSFFSANPADNAASELAQARQHFFMPRRYRDPFGQDAFVDFDTHDLLMVETRDALGNHVTVDANDYRVLQPCLVSDPNRNQTEVAFDTLGMVVGTAVMGKPLPAPVEGDTLGGFVTDLTQAQLDGFFEAADPHAIAATLLKDAATRVVYDLDRFRRTQRANPNDPTKWQPACAATLARETHAKAPLPPQGLKIQLSFSYSDGFGREIQKKIQAEPGPLDVNDPQAPVVNPRWVGSGWTIFNNKGKPVRQYEPFFTDTHRFEFDVRIGVSPVLFYDPTGRVVATLHPDHTCEKVVFDAWQQTTYDTNDTCAPRNSQTGDPRTDPDIGGFLARYFAALPASPARPWQTWYAQRIDGALGKDERSAAQRAAAHADTPTTAHVDVLGRPFLTVVRNRVVCAGHDLDGSEENFATRIELDIEDNKRVVRDAVQQGNDPLGRVVIRYAYDMLGNPIYQLGMDAGARWTIQDVLGKSLRIWDSRGHSFTTAYDALRRPVETTVRGTTAESDPRTLNRDVLIERTEYGEGVASAEALNLRGRVFRHFDSAGVVTNARLDASGAPAEAYDFKGNQLHSTQRLVGDYKAIIDWHQNPQLQSESFESSTRFDALNRPVQSIAPHSSLKRADGSSSFNVAQRVFNEANLLERVDVWLERAAEPVALLDPDEETPSPVGVANIDYDAKGRRLLIDYKNGAGTFYHYDPLTFRLTELLTRRKAEDLQKLRYTYDPAGNVTHIRDDAQQTIYFKNTWVEPHNDHTYDALYRLIQSTGREHLGQGGAPIAYSHSDAGRVGLVSADVAGHFAPNDGQAMGAYVERYVYDAVGNFLKMQHRRNDPANPGWTRAYDYLEASRIEDGNDGASLKTSNRLTRAALNPAGGSTQPEVFQYDAHGSFVRMPHLGGGSPGPNMHWDYKDQLSQVDLGGGGTAFYVYDAMGQRVRKVWEKAPGLTEERIYLGGFEIFRKHTGTSAATISADTAALERETLHVMDDQQRIALVETRTLDTAGDDRAPRRLIRYQFGNHLGSACLELDDGAQIISYEEYAPYGSSTYQAVRSQTDTPKRYRYSGKERDEESSLYYNDARYYTPWLGRWTATDPAGLVDGSNSYAYVRNNPLRYTDSTGTQCDPTNSSCLDPTLETVDDQSMTCHADSSSSSSSSSSDLAVAGGATDLLAAFLRPAAPPMMSSAPAQLANSADDLAIFLRAQAGFETGRLLPPTFNSGSASPFGTAAHARATGVLDEMQRLGFLGAENLYSEVRAVNGIVTQIGGTPGGPAGAHNIDLLHTRPGTTLAVGDDISAGFAQWLGDLKYGGGVMDAKYAVHGSPLVTINGRTAPGPMPSFPEPHMTSGARWFGGGMGALNAGGGAFMLASVDFENDPGILSAGKITSGTASLVGGGLEIGGAWFASAGLLKAGAAFSTVGFVIAGPIIVHELGKPQGWIASDPLLTERALREGRNPFCAQCHGPGGALDPNNDWNSRDPARRAAFVNRLQWVNLDNR